MINPAQIVSMYVDRLRRMPDVVRCVNNDPMRIFAYRDSPPEHTSLYRALYRMKVPSVMIVWMGTSPNNDGGLATYGHDLSIYVKAQDSVAGENTPTFANIVTAILNSRSDLDSLPLIYQELMSALEPIDPPTVRRINDNEQSIDLFELVTRVNERYDTGIGLDPVPFQLFA